MLHVRGSRRWLGGLSLGFAVLLLLMAELVFRGRISPAGYLVLYLACFLLTLVAVVAALAELRSIAAKSLKERQDLFNSTLGQIRDEVSPLKRSRSGPQKPPSQDGNGPYERN